MDQIGAQKHDVKIPSIIQDLIITIVENSHGSF